MPTLPHSLCEGCGDIIKIQQTSITKKNVFGFIHLTRPRGVKHVFCLLKVRSSETMWRVGGFFKKLFCGHFSGYKYSLTYILGCSCKAKYTVQK